MRTLFGCGIASNFGDARLLFRSGGAAGTFAVTVAPLAFAGLAFGAVDFLAALAGGPAGLACGAVGYPAGLAGGPGTMTDADFRLDDACPVA